MVRQEVTKEKIKFKKKKIISLQGMNPMNGVDSFIRKKRYEPAGYLGKKGYLDVLLVSVILSPVHVADRVVIQFEKILSFQPHLEGHFFQNIWQEMLQNEFIKSVNFEIFLFV